MPVMTSADWDFEIQALDGTWLPLMLVLQADEHGVRQPKEFAEAIAAAATDEPLSEWLDPRPQESWFGGIGIDYDVAPGCDTFTSPGYVFPGGQAVDVAVTTSQNTASPIVAMTEFNSMFWVAQRGTGVASSARVMVSTDKTGVGAGALINSLNLGVGEYIRDMTVAQDGNGNLRLYVSSSDVDGATGRLHAHDGTAWTSTAVNAFAANGRNRMAAVWWTDQDGITGQRLVAISSNHAHISYTKANSNPMIPSNWIEGVRTGSAQPGGELVAARKHVWINGRDNLFDINEVGESPSLTSYTPLQQGNGLCVAYLDGWVYRSFGQGIDRVRVDQGAVLQEAPNICTPGWGTKAESPWLIGWATALLIWNGGLLCATHSVIESKPAIYWGKDRSHIGVETPNPLVWHGPFAIGPANTTVSRMAITEIGLTNEVWLWAATFLTDQASAPTLARISLPGAGGAMANLRGGGAHRYADGAGSGQWQPYSRLELLPDTVDDKAATKHIHQITYGTLNLGSPTASTRLEVYTRADPVPGSGAWGSAQTVAVSPTASVTPVAASGNKVQNRVDLFSPSGAATPAKPAILDSIRPEYWKTVPDVDAWTFDAEYGPGVVSLSNMDWANRGLSVDAQTDALLALCRGGRTVLRDRQDRRRTVKVKHALPRKTTLIDGPYGKRMTVRLTLADLGPAS